VEKAGKQLGLKFGLIGRTHAGSDRSKSHCVSRIYDELVGETFSPDKVKDDKEMRYDESYGTPMIILSSS
jgi:hypothetical protein